MFSVFGGIKIFAKMFQRNANYASAYDYLDDWS